MRILVTGSAGHLGEALMRRLPLDGHEVRGLDLQPGPSVDVVGSITDAGAVRAALDGIDAVLHTAALHKPHVRTHTKAQFVETNVTGTLTLLEGAVAAGARSFVFTSTTSAFGRALVDRAGAAATWIDESVVPRPKNIYGVTKCAAEDLCELVHRDHRLPVVVLRTSRFFPEPDDAAERASAYPDLNLKVLELLHRRADIDDLVAAHALAVDRAPALGFAKLVASAPTPFQRGDAQELARDAAAVIRRRCSPRTAEVFRDYGWTMPASIDRVYDSRAAQVELGWKPRFTFDEAVARLARGAHPLSGLTTVIGAKGYHEPSGTLPTLRPEP